MVFCKARRVQFSPSRWVLSLRWNAHSQSHSHLTVTKFSTVAATACNFSGLSARQVLATSSVSRSTSRSFTTASTDLGFPTVDLAYESFQPSNNLASVPLPGPIVILPGLLSSAELWRSLSRSLLSNLQVPIYTLSLRNQGNSPHLEPMLHRNMAADVLRFCQSHGLTNVSLLGHSLGAKVAMVLALQPDLPSGLLANLIVVDSAPINRDLDAQIFHYIDGMKDVERQNVATKEAAAKILAQYTMTRLEVRFLLSNLKSKSPETPDDPLVPLRFRIPLDIIYRSLIPLAKFPCPTTFTWHGNALFLQATNSDHLGPIAAKVAKFSFPKLQLISLQGTHWLPFDNPNGFLSAVTSFLRAQAFTEISSPDKVVT